MIGTVLVLIVLTLTVIQFRGGFDTTTRLTLIADRSGLLIDRGAKVTYNGVQVGRVAAIRPRRDGPAPGAEVAVDIESRFTDVIPANAAVDITAATIFGNQVVAFRSPPNPVGDRISSVERIDVTHVTTELETLFETMLSISEKVDPIKLNTTLSATAEALTGLGGRFGRSLADANVILNEVNGRIPRLGPDLQRLSEVAEIYTTAAPEFYDALDHLTTTSRTVTTARTELDAALLAAIGFGGTAAEVAERAAPAFVRGIADMVTTSRTLNEYSPMLFCTVRNYANLLPVASEHLGGAGYAMRMRMRMLPGAPNPYIYPDNLPRVNARGGPAGAPGCWQPVTRDFWPAPYLVTDTGVSLAPYNHVELGQPSLTDLVWGRQLGENTINP